jgi:FMN reductase
MRELTGRQADHVIDVIELGPALLGWGNPEVAAAVSLVTAADILVVSSPTFKATYSGLLKLFLDQFGAGQLGGVVTFPVMLGASPRHAMAPEMSLRPVLVEIGASCPAPGLYLLDSEGTGSAEFRAWLTPARCFVPARRR